MTRTSSSLAGAFALLIVTRARHTRTAQLRATVEELDGDDVDAVIQVGTNLAFGALAAKMEAERKKPILAINTAIYWHALRKNGIADKVPGWGSLLERY